MLEMQHVTKRFGTFTALNDLTMTVPRGCVYGLVGPNGAGKTTAIRHLTGVYRQDSGLVSMEGVPIYENEALKSRIGFIPDEIFFFPSASVSDMRAFYKGMYPHFDDDLYHRLREVFQLPENGPIRRFSKGMQKQAAFHLAMCLRPDVLILDEPVDGLDPVMRRQVWSILLSDVASREATVLVSSHNLRELEDICDHVGLLHRGGILFSRDLDDMKLGMYKMQCIFPNPLPDSAWEGFDILHKEQRGSLYTITARGSREELLAKVNALNPTFCEMLPLTLEEIFINETEVAGYDVKKLLF